MLADVPHTVTPPPVHRWPIDPRIAIGAVLALYLLSGIYVVSVGHNNRKVIDAIKTQLDTLCFSAPMHGTNPVAVQLANLLAELAPGDLSAIRRSRESVEAQEMTGGLTRRWRAPFTARLHARRACRNCALQAVR